MRAERRLAKLEGALSPKAAVLLWLAEAHAFPSLPAYVDWLKDQPMSAAPHVRIPEQVEAAVRASMRGAPRTDMEAVVARAVKEAVFLVELVIRLNLASEEATRFEDLRYAALFWEMRGISAEAEIKTGSEGPQGRRAIARRWAARRGLPLAGEPGFGERGAAAPRAPLPRWPKRSLPRPRAGLGEAAGDRRAAHWPGRLTDGPAGRHIP